MVLFNKIDQKVWASGDFTTAAALDLSGTIYSDEALSSTYDISSHTGELQFRNPDTGDIETTTTSALTLNSDGTWYWRPTQSTTINKGPKEVWLKLTKSGEEIKAISVNGSGVIRIV